MNLLHVRWLFGTSPIGTGDVHGMADVVAKLVHEHWVEGHTTDAVVRSEIDAGEAISEWLEGLGHGHDSALRKALVLTPGHALMVTLEHAARMGYALALTQERQRDGWDAWLKAAEAELERAGCSVEAHLEEARGHWISVFNTMAAAAGSADRKVHP